MSTVHDDDDDDHITGFATHTESGESVEDIVNRRMFADRNFAKLYEKARKNEEFSAGLVDKWDVFGGAVDLEAAQTDARASTKQRKLLLNIYDLREDEIDSAAAAANATASAEKRAAYKRSLDGDTAAERTERLRRRTAESLAPYEQLAADEERWAESTDLAVASAADDGSESDPAMQVARVPIVPESSLSTDLRPSLHNSTMPGTMNSAAVILIRNIVSQTTLSMPIRLSFIVSRMRYLGVWYQPDMFPAPIFKLANPKCTVFLFETGVLLTTGSCNMKDTRQGTLFVIKELTKLTDEFGARPYANLTHTPIKVRNMVGSTFVNFQINIESFALANSTFVHYDRKRFPGASVSMSAEPSGHFRNTNVKVLVFDSGSMNITGARNRYELLRAHDLLYDRLLAHRIDVGAPTEHHKRRARAELKRAIAAGRGSVIVMDPKKLNERMQSVQIAASAVSGRITDGASSTTAPAISDVVARAVDGEVALRNDANLTRSAAIDADSSAGRFLRNALAYTSFDAAEQRQKEARALKAHQAEHGFEKTKLVSLDDAADFFDDEGEYGGGRGGGAGGGGAGLEL